MYPKVVAVTPVRNRQEKTARFLNCISKQTYPNLHVVIVDANSTDGTQDMILSTFPKVTLIHVGDESYWTASTNRGIEFALNNQADYILTINDDSYIEEDFITQLVEVATRHQTPILGCRIEHMAHPGLIWSLGAYSRWGTQDILQLAYSSMWIDDLPRQLIEQEILEVEALAGNGVLIHQSIFNKIGLYNEVFLPHYHADSEFLMRAKKAGIKAYASVLTVLYNDQSYTAEELVPKGNIFFKKKSPLFFLPVIYIVFVYCPLKQKLPTLLAVFRLTRLLPLRGKIRLRARVSGAYQKCKNLGKKIAHRGFVSVNRLINFFS